MCIQPKIPTYIAVVVSLKFPYTQHVIHSELETTGVKTDQNECLEQWGVTIENDEVSLPIVFPINAILTT